MSRQKATWKGKVLAGVAKNRANLTAAACSVWQLDCCSLTYAVGQYGGLQVQLSISNVKHSKVPVLGKLVIACDKIPLSVLMSTL